MICVDQNGQAVEISVADQMWLDDAYFKEKQLRLGTDAPRAALAYRVSTKGQVDHDDIPMQKIDCRKFAQKQGWRVVKEVAEKSVSGSKVSASKRDAIQQLKEEAANGEFDILLVYMFDRLGRIESETPFVLEWFVQHGIEMWSTHEGQQKIETHGDKLMNYIRFWQAAGESEKTSIRTRDRIRQIVSSGHYTGGFYARAPEKIQKGAEKIKTAHRRSLHSVPLAIRLISKPTPRTFQVHTKQNQRIISCFPAWDRMREDWKQKRKQAPEPDGGGACVWILNLSLCPSVNALYQFCVLWLSTGRPRPTEQAG